MTDDQVLKEERAAPGESRRRCDSARLRSHPCLRSLSSSGPAAHPLSPWYVLCLFRGEGHPRSDAHHHGQRDGEVKVPGTYTLSGFANDAYKKSLRVLRKNGRMKSVFNVEEFEMSDFKMFDGDSVNVDSIIDRFENMVEVKGAVFRPGMYNLGEKVHSVRPSGLRPFDELRDRRGGGMFCSLRFARA